MRVRVKLVIAQYYKDVLPSVKDALQGGYQDSELVKWNGMSWDTTKLQAWLALVSQKVLRLAQT
jgi:hypothetical protein